MISLPNMCTFPTTQGTLRVDEVKEQVNEVWEEKQMGKLFSIVPETPKRSNIFEDSNINIFNKFSID